MEAGARSGGLKGVARNILASPRAPSCVLNHFPVDSAVCNPIIGVSPPGKLLFYSRTTRAPGVPYTAIFSVFPSLVPLLFLAFSLRSTTSMLFDYFFFFFLFYFVEESGQFCGLFFTDLVATITRYR